MLSKADQEQLLEHSAEEAHWISVSDLMSGLMMVFLLISIIYMVKIEKETQKIREVAMMYDRFTLTALSRFV